MEQIRDTSLEHGVIFWPIRPPKTSMLVIVKATFALEDGRAALAESQDPATGELYWDDDPERSVRYPSDFSLVKPRGECFVVGSCRTLTERPVERTLASFRIGAVQKSLQVHGDRTWAGNSPSRPVPFTEMPLCWERSFGGHSIAANPVGRGMHEDATGVVWLPNVEDPAKPIVGSKDRPTPVGSFPIGMSWKARSRYVGTYGPKWQKTRAPWLAEDFRFEFFNEAPTDQQIEGFWRGDEQIELRHLHPTQPAVRAKLPGVLARAFIERGEQFDEVALAFDTLTIDADRGLAFAVWRGTVEMSHGELAPDGIDRLFVMHEDAANPSSVSACRDRMNAKIAADLAAQDLMAGVEPPPTEEAPVPAVDETIADGGLDPNLQALMDAKAPREPEGEDPIEKLKRDLTNAGIDVAAVMAQAEGHELAEPEPADTAVILAAIENSPVELPTELIEELLNPQPDPPDDAPETAAPAPPPDLRQMVIDTHRRGNAVTGDYSGVNLAGLELPGLDARGAVLMDANFRGSNLTGARLDGASLVRADFLSAMLTKASLRDADLTGAVLEDAKLGDAKLGGAMLERAELQEAVLDGARLEKADLTGANLSGASLVGARCAAAVFNGACLKGTKFGRANLSSARFYGVQAADIDLDGAEIEGLRVGRGADLTGANVRRARGDNSNWRDSKLDGANFAGSALNGADFSRSEMTGVRLVGSIMRKARFIDSVLPQASLAGADMYEATFRDAELRDASFRGANLYRADFYRARGEGVDLSGANLDGTTWDGK